MNNEQSSIRDRDKVIYPKVCFACGQEKDPRLLVLHVPQMKTYCKDLEACTNPKDHIYNLMIKNPILPEYQVDPVKTYSAEALERSMKMYFNEDAYEVLVKKFIGRTATARFNLRQGLFLAKLAQEKEITNVQEILRYLVDDKMNSDEGRKIMAKELVKTDML
jgi:hypothetical protein